MQLSELSNTFWEQGYLVIEDFFSNNTMDGLQNLILNHYGMDPAYEHDASFIAKSATEVIPWFPQQSGEQAFDEIEQCPNMFELTQAILGAGWQGLYCMTMFSKKGTLVIIHGHTWHRVLPIKGEYRLSTNYRAIPENTPESITDICVYRNMLYQFSTSKVLEDRLV